MPPKFLRDGILLRSLTLTLAVFVLTALITITYSAHSVRIQAGEKAQTRLLQLLETVYSTVQVACFVKNEALAKEVASGLLSNNDIVRVRINDEQLTLADMEKAPGEDRETKRIEYSREIISPFSQAEVIGRITLFRSQALTENEISTEIRERTLLLIGQLALMASAIITTLILLVVKPMRNLSSALRQMAPEEGERLSPPKGHSHTELGALAHDVNRLAERLVGALAAERNLRLQREIDEMKFHAIFDNAESALFILQENGDISSWNHAAETLFQLPPMQAEKPAPSILKLPWAKPELITTFLQRTLTRGNSGTLEAEIHWGQHRPIWLKIILSPIGNQTLQGIAHDISDLKESEASAKRQAVTDPLTGLLNRSGFQAHLEQRIAAQGKSGFSMLLIDLDKFRQITEGIGVPAGDNVLQAVASRLISNTKPQDAIARLSADIFAVMLSNLDQPSTAIRIGDRIAELIRHPYQVENTSIELSASIGVVCYPQDGDTPAALLRHAELTIDKAKQHGGNLTLLFTPQLAAQAEKRRQTENDLRKALARNEFLLHFQPIIDLKNKTLCGAEALLRWQHPTLGMRSPTEFIPILEESGLINEVGLWILESACAQLAQWAAQGQALHLSINVSARQIPTGLPPLQVAAALKRHNIAAGQLALEITEGILISNSDEALAWLQSVRQLGVKIYLDDFGTGYSSLSYLKRFPVDTLKVDQSFVKDMNSMNNEHSLVQAIIAMGKSLGLNIIAEGVETLAQASELRALGCHNAQGYYFSKPLEIAQFASFAATLGEKFDNFR